MQNKNELTDFFESIELPENSKDYLLKGMNKAKKEENKWFIKKRYKISICAMLALVLVIIGANTSPTFAEKVTKIPLVKNIIPLFNDKSIEIADKNNYGVTLDNVTKNNDVKLTLTNYYADSNVLFIYYKIDRLNSNTQVQYSLDSPQLFDENGFIETNSTVNNTKILGIPKHSQGFIKLTLPKKIDLKNQLYLSCSVMETYSLSDSKTKKNPKEVLKISKFKVPEIKEIQKEFSINKEIELRGTKILIDKLEVSPIRSTLTIKEPLDNTVKILSLFDIALEDGMGNKWTKLDKENLMYQLDFEERVFVHKFYFDSFYYENPEEIYLTGLKFEIVEKENEYFTVDLENKTVSSPYDTFIKLDSYKKDDKYMEITFKNLVAKDPNYSDLNFDFFHDTPYTSTKQCSFTQDTDSKQRIDTYIIKFPTRLADTLNEFKVSKGTNIYITEDLRIKLK